MEEQREVVRLMDIQSMEDARLDPSTLEVRETDSFLV
jgi:hypothetical protein